MHCIYFVQKGTFFRPKLLIKDPITFYLLLVIILHLAFNILLLNTFKPFKCSLFYSFVPFFSTYKISLRDLLTFKSGFIPIFQKASF